MVILDIDMPESCSKCPLMRCGKCIAKDSMKVTDDDYDIVRHPECPIVTYNGHIPLNDKEDITQTLNGLKTRIAELTKKELDKRKSIVSLVLNEKAAMEYPVIQTKTAIEQAMMQREAK